MKSIQTLGKRVALYVFRTRRSTLLAAMATSIAKMVAVLAAVAVAISKIHSPEPFVFWAKVAMVFIVFAGWLVDVYFKQRHYVMRFETHARRTQIRRATLSRVGSASDPSL